MLDQSSGLQKNKHDPVSELLMGMRLRGASYGRLQLSPPFGIRFPAGPEARFHFVARGKVLLRAPGEVGRELACGDAVLLPRGEVHEIVTGSHVQIRDYESYTRKPLCADVAAVEACIKTADRENDTLIFTGRMEFELDTLHPLVGLMPPIMSVGALIGRQPELMPLLDAMEREMGEERVGSAGILARLADVIAASIVRGWVECGCGDATGWIEALRDPRLGRVIAALHREPGRNWTLADMAGEMGSSRSVFAKRFVEVTGVTPQRYVLALRMRLAEQWFRRDKLSIDTAARRLGFGSQAAFARAFKRVVGEPPGHTRKKTAAASALENGTTGRRKNGAAREI
ncbi:MULTISPECIES: AraC family transcriptional regulator [unclassified Shinella]|uniref:AraC family transcriptional regulator n=1 Tax=unclassified Shinella TaxID=2643062 RepID=UPI00234E809A|nr:MULTISPECIES: AraC family transcriptional regulator [unclassified Shinella]MDC7260658.1 AraC family transcriptional regulator [Shinella sp. HY16]MDC7267553.1 AraC family transcriptional regulator [Shinella sp. YZ44]